MKSYVADTHAVFWYLTRSSELGPAARAAFDEADNGLALIFVPAIVLAELYYMNLRKGLVLNYNQAYLDLSTNAQFVLLPDEPSSTLDFDRDAAISEMHDRMIVGAARRLDATLITRDRDIISAAIVPTVWLANI